MHLSHLEALRPSKEVKAHTTKKQKQQLERERERGRSVSLVVWLFGHLLCFFLNNHTIFNRLLTRQKKGQETSCMHVVDDATLAIHPILEDMQNADKKLLFGVLLLEERKEHFGMLVLYYMKPKLPICYVIV